MKGRAAGRAGKIGPVNHKIILVLGFALSAGAAFRGQEEPAGALPQARSEAVSCQGLPQQGRTPTLVSSAGYKAMAEVKASLVSGAQAESSCKTQWLLHVADPDNKVRTVAAPDRRGDVASENTFEIYGWSRDGDRLLAAMTVAAGDWGNTVPAIYSIKQSQLWAIDLAPLFAKLAKEGCDLDFRPLGFVADGRVALEVSALEKAFLDDGSAPCFPDGRWLLDYERAQVAPDARHLKTEVYGTVLR